MELDKQELEEFRRAFKNDQIVIRAVKLNQVYKICQANYDAKRARFFQSIYSTLYFSLSLIMEIQTWS